MITPIIQTLRFEKLMLRAKPSNNSALPISRRRFDEADTLWVYHERLEKSHRPSNDARRI